MKGKQTTITGKFLGTLAILILTAALLIGCQAQAQTSAPAAQTAAHTASAASAAATTPAAQTTAAAVASTTAAAAATSTTAEAKTLKIGVVSWLGWPIGLDRARMAELQTEIDNEKGGIDIGGEKYKVQLIEYDSNNNQATEVAAINKLIFEDKVKFIITDGMNEAAWLSIIEANKIVTLGMGMNYKVSLSPDYHYYFAPSFSNGCHPVITGWMIKNYPDLMKNVVVAFPDSMIGHIGSDIMTNVVNASGNNKMDSEFYPQNVQDLSSLGTKVKSLNPTSFDATNGGSAMDGLAYKAVWQAGYRGKYFGTTMSDSLALAQVMPAEVLEGFIAGAWPTEFDPPLNEQAQELRQAWIDKYSKWDAPDCGATSSYPCLVAALQKAGSLDTDKVADVLANGLQFESPCGLGQMVSRPDLGNNRTVDSIVTVYIKQVKDSKPTLIDTIKLEDALQYFRMAFPSSPSK